jgi:hypothetical protein
VSAAAFKASHLPVAYYNQNSIPCVIVKEKGGRVGVGEGIRTPNTWSHSPVL